MKSVKEQALHMIAAIFDVMEVDSGSFEAVSNGASEDLVIQDEPSSHGDQKLIELCW
jgi:hypothetical protein